MLNAEQSLEYRQAILDQALIEGIKRNEEQTKFWNDYKKRHKKVTEALEILPMDISMNCMVPIGNCALMKGKLTHTNEILVHIGDSYFAKYSAYKAKALCNRRIQNADEQLKYLEQERNLFEMRQVIPFEQNAFGNEEGEALTEHWDNTKMNEWRVKHRQREKEYHEKLAKLRKQQEEKTDIKTEEDIFKHLDELELEEELGDEYNRLEEQQRQFYGEDLNGELGEVYYESDEESISDDDMNEQIQAELEKLREIQIQRRRMNDLQISGNTSIEKNESVVEETRENEVSKSAQLVKVTVEEGSVIKKDNNSVSNEDMSIDKPKIIRRVSFAEKNLDIKDSDSSVPDIADLNQLNDNDDDDTTIKIEFQHSSHDPIIEEAPGDKIETPKDFYKVFVKPKSILKKSPNDIIYVRDTALPTYFSESESDENEPSESNLKFVFKDVEENIVGKSKVAPAIATTSRPVSNFKMGRLKQ